jgi:hypothetical protein
MILAIHSSPNPKSNLERMVINAAEASGMPAIETATPVGWIRRPAPSGDMRCPPASTIRTPWAGPRMEGSGSRSSVPSRPATLVFSHRKRAMCG